MLLQVGGMHCVNCDVLVERRFKSLPNVSKVRAHHSSGKVEVFHTDKLDIGSLQNAVADDGYTVALWQKQASRADLGSKNAGRDYAEIGAAFLILVGLFAVLKQFDILPQNLAIPNNISYGLAVAIGVVASMSTCIAVTGGLLVAVAAKYNDATTGLSGAQRFKPHIFFNAGRIVSYTLLGGAIGALGSTFTLSPTAGGMLMILASVIMIVLGLQMLRLFPWLKRLQPKMPKFLAHKIHDLTEREETKGGAFALGASTFFLPCGFTQALQLYVLAKGSFTIGALTMLAFSLGTLPALISLSMISSFATGAFQRYFLKFAGVAVVLLGLFNIQSGLTLAATSGNFASTSATPNPANEARLQETKVVAGKQIVNMRVVGYSYEPHQFAVVAGCTGRMAYRRAAGCGLRAHPPCSAGRRSKIPVIERRYRHQFYSAGSRRDPVQLRHGHDDARFQIHRQREGSERCPGVARKRSQQRQSQVRFPPTSVARSKAYQRDLRPAKPEVLQEAFAEMEKRQQTAEAEQHRAAVKENAAAIFATQRQVVLGNPQGDVTLVEFFDYNCAYCKRALGDMVELLKTDPKLKIVLREFPVLGEGSVEAASVAIAVRMQDESGQKYLDFHQKLLGGRGQADRVRALAVAKEIGLDMARSRSDMASEEVKTTIDENLKLAESVGLTGTPSYVIGSDVLVGAVGVDALREKINVARK